ncbi:NAD(P)/FAD-dependent oxidoreductase [Haloferacaceae archaeon DSL9]
MDHHETASGDGRTVDGDGLAVAVVGAGAVGITAAYDLARAGATVTVFDRGEIAAGSSGRAAGVCYNAFAEDIDAAIGARAQERFREFSGTGDFEYEPCPYVMVAREGDGRVAGAIEAAAARMRSHGTAVSLASPADLGERFPLVVDDVAAAAVAETAGWTDPATYVYALADLAADAGATIRERTPVELSLDPSGVVVDGETHAFDAVIVAAGAHTKRVCATAGLAVPLKPYRVQALTSARPYDGPICYDATAGIYFRPHPTGLLAGDGTEPVEIDPDEWDRAADDWFVDGIRDGLRRRADYDIDVERAWAGLCVATPDGNPLLGELADGIYLAAGWQGHGFMRAPATGELIAEQVRGVREPIDSFAPTRFDGDEQFEIVEGMALDEPAPAVDSVDID